MKVSQNLWSFRNFTKEFLLIKEYSFVTIFHIYIFVLVSSKYVTIFSSSLHKTNLYNQPVCFIQYPYNTVLFYIKFAYLLFIVLFLNYCDINFCEYLYGSICIHSSNILDFIIWIWIFFFLDTIIEPVQWIHEGMSRERRGTM